MKVEVTELEVFVLLAEDGSAECGMSEEAAGERFAEQVTDNAETGRRMVKVKLRVPLPKPIEIEAEATEEEEQASEATA